jgi:hypothetical protein
VERLSKALQEQAVAKYPGSKTRNAAGKSVTPAAVVRGQPGKRKAKAVRAKSKKTTGGKPATRKSKA